MSASNIFPFVSYWYMNRNSSGFSLGYFDDNKLIVALHLHMDYGDG